MVNKSLDDIHCIFNKRYQRAAAQGKHRQQVMPILQGDPCSYVQTAFTPLLLAPSVNFK
jgi:hypothetical protein